MDWLPGVIAGVLSGTGTGLGAALWGPGAAARAEGRKSLREERKARVAGVRELVHEQEQHVDSSKPMGLDPRFRTIEPDLSPDVAARYTGSNLHLIRIGGHHQVLLTDVARLEKKWGLR